MRYENRQPPEGVNLTDEHPLGQVFRLLLGAVVLVVLLVLVLRLGVGWLAARVPFDIERRAMASASITLGDPEAAPELQHYLESLARRLSANMPVPEGMAVSLHYDPDSLFNAYATLGGNLLFYRGLLERMPNENTLAMVMAHEIAHVMHRDPIASLGGGVASVTALLLVTGNAGSAGNLLELTGGVTSLRFSRDMELAADASALTALGKTYGHVAGADTLFRELQAERREGEGDRWWQRFLSTHPLDAERIARLEAQAAAEGWPAEGRLTPLPDDFAEWLNASASHRDARPRSRYNIFLRAD